MVKVSVLMPCYNVEKTVAVTLESLQQQTHDSFEIVAVDDGSNDETLKILQAYAANDERINVVARPHEGIIPAMNAGLETCQGEYIARMDADDIALADRLSQQARYLDSHKEIDLVSCLVRGFPEDTLQEGFRIYIEWLNSLITDADIRREIFIESPLSHPSVMYRKQTVMAIGGYQERGWAEDYDLWLRMYLSGSQFAKIPDVLVKWREHPQRLTRTDSRYSLENFIRAKAFYLMQGPLKNRDAVIIWGAGMNGRRLSKHLLRLSCPLTAFLDVDDEKIGKTRHGIPVRAIDSLTDLWQSYKNPVLLSAVGSRGKRDLIRDYLTEAGLVETQDWWAVA